MLLDRQRLAFQRNFFGANRCFSFSNYFLIMMMSSPAGTMVPGPSMLLVRRKRLGFFVMGRVAPRRSRCGLERKRTFLDRFAIPTRFHVAHFNCLVSIWVSTMEEMHGDSSEPCCGLGLLLWVDNTKYPEVIAFGWATYLMVMFVVVWKGRVEAFGI